MKRKRCVAGATPLMQGRTTLVIAHRLSIVRELDRILVFDHGRVVEDGNHAALLHLRDGIYRRLVERHAEGMGDDLEGGIASRYRRNNMSRPTIGRWSALAL